MSISRSFQKECHNIEIQKTLHVQRGFPRYFSGRGASSDSIDSLSQLWRLVILTLICINRIEASATDRAVKIEGIILSDSLIVRESSTIGGKYLEDESKIFDSHPRIQLQIGCELWKEVELQDCLFSPRLCRRLPRRILNCTFGMGSQN
jgi:hypothetical protein